MRNDFLAKQIVSWEITAKNSAKRTLSGKFCCWLTKNIAVCDVQSIIFQVFVDIRFSLRIKTIILAKNNKIIHFFHPENKIIHFGH